MSSDSSDDDFSYTNTASLLKNMTRKIITDEGNSSSDSPVITVKDNKRNTSKSTITSNIDLTEAAKCQKLSTARKKTTSKPTAIILCSPLASLQSDHQETNKNESESVILLSDNELDKSFNIISEIDACLERNSRTSSTRGKTGRGRGKRKNSTRITRQMNKKTNNGPVTIDTIEIDPDYPILNSEINVSDDINYDLTVKVLWKSQYVKRIKIRRFEKLRSIFTLFAEEEDVPEDRLLFTVKDRVISQTDTPYSLGLTVASIIEGGTLSARSYLSSGIEYSSGTIKLKVQMKDLKKPMVLTVKVTDHMDVLMSQCAEELQCPVQLLKFYFDGDVILPTDSPMSLQLEDGECIDCMRVTKP